MAVITLSRQHGSDGGVIGHLYADNGSFICHTIEPPWRHNRQGVSCVPVGVYRMTWLERSSSGRWRRVYQLHDVPGRSGILIHTGNCAGDRARGYLSHSHGCILVGKKVGVLMGQIAVLRSQAAMGELIKIAGTGDTTINIVEDWQ